MQRSHLCALVLIVAFGMVGTAHGQSELYEKIVLGVGQVKCIGNNDLCIGFDGILSESRCPEGALCFWEGDAAAKLWVEQPSKEKFIFELHTHHGFQWQIEFGGYLITLIKVTPYPRLGEKIDPREYVVTLAIRDMHASVEPTTWSRIRAIFE